MTPEIDGDATPQLNQRIIACTRCPRLSVYIRKVAQEKRRAFASEEYWGRPVPNFGDPDADRLIVGLAPAAHGANRTGRMFSGDRSGDFLFAALHRTGAASQPHGSRPFDGLHLKGVMITACCHCAPPDNKPTTVEVKNCGGYLVELIESRAWKSVLCLGGLAWNETMKILRSKRPPGPRPKFGHGAQATLTDGTVVFGCFHPSQQNTFTGRLTEAMIDEVLERFLSH